MFALPKLPYDYSALEPHIDAKTMEIHHSKHHQGYTDKLNAALESAPSAPESIEELMASVSKYDTAVRNNGGGYYNHLLFWESLSPDSDAGGGEPTGKLAEHIEAEFDSFESFKTEFEKTAGAQFGSGWGWLVVDGGELKVGATPNQDNPLMDVAEFSGTPLLGVDVWEHAYYLHYQNRRPDYLKAIWNVVNWDVVSQRYAAATA